jgi:hypothetical protein
MHVIDIDKRKVAYNNHVMMFYFMPYFFYIFHMHYTNIFNIFYVHCKYIFPKNFAWIIWANSAFRIHILVF